MNITISLPIGIKTPTSISVQKEIRQGAVSSLRFFNNSVVGAQQVVKPRFLYLGQDFSLLQYADGILYLIISFSRFEEFCSVEKLK